MRVGLVGIQVPLNERRRLEKRIELDPQSKAWMNWNRLWYTMGTRAIMREQVARDEKHGEALRMAHNATKGKLRALMKHDEETFVYKQDDETVLSWRDDGLSFSEIAAIEQDEFIDPR